MERIAQHLTEHGIHLSMQRVAIMKYLMEHKTHPTVDDIYNDLHSSMPTLSKTTVYNTLDLLVKHGAIKALTIDKRMTHYDGCLDPHAHFMCRQCHSIFDVEMDNNLTGHIQSRPELKVEQVELNYTGLCDKCRSN